MSDNAIKLAEDIVKEMEERGPITVPDGCVTGEAFEEWLVNDNTEYVQMTIDEAIYCLQSYQPNSPDDMCSKCKYYGYYPVKDGETPTVSLCRSAEARRLAIKALQLQKEPLIEEMEDNNE